MPGSRPEAILHSFSGPVDYAEAALALGVGISFSGLVFVSNFDRTFGRAGSSSAEGRLP